jgi:hypothetical protein
MQLKFDFRPFFRGDGGKPKLSVALRPDRQTSTQPPDLAPLRTAPKRAESRAVRNTANLPTVAQQDATPTRSAIQMRQLPADIGTADLVERSKAELNTASRRQMLDPMFAPTARRAPEATPLERATAITGMKIEERGADVMRVTNADGSHYCLQRLPEIATRDIPVPLVAVPMKCQ